MTEGNRQLTDPVQIKTHGREVLERLLQAYRGYYNVLPQSSIPEFAAEAEFRLHDEQYFLVKAARLSESDSREIIFFALTDSLDAQQIERLCTLAWEEGVRRTQPGPNHRGTDIGLVVLAQSVDADAARAVRRFNRTKSYRLGLQGYSRFRAVAYDLTQNVTVRNRMGDTLEKVISDIFF